MSLPVEKLRVAEDDELPYLISKSEDHLPDSVTVHRLLSIGFQRNLVDKKRTKIYVPVDKTLPFFIIITGVLAKNRNTMTAYWNPKDISSEMAKNLLKSLPDWNWEEPSMMVETPLLTIAEIDKIILEEDGLSNNKLISYPVDVAACIYDKENESYESYKDPRWGYHLDSLEKKDADIIYKDWDYQFWEDLEGIERYIKNLPSVGAYKGETLEEEKSKFLNIVNNNNKNYLKSDCSLVAWALVREQGGICCVYTVPDHRKKGLFTAIMKELMKKLLDIGISPYSCIVEGNLISVKAHEKLGFKMYCHLSSHFYLYKGMDINEF